MSRRTSFGKIVLAVVLLLVLVLVWLTISNVIDSVKDRLPSLGGVFTSPEITTLVWEDLILGNKLPEFEEKEAEIVTNSKERLCLYFYNIGNSQFRSYILKCKEAGFDIDIEESSTNYSAYNSEGYHLHLSYWDFSNDKKMTIDLSDPKMREPIVWPKSDLVKTLPIPNTSQQLIGEVSYESPNYYCVYLVDIDKTYFAEYVALCMANGYTKDYYKSYDYFSAENEDGYSLRVEYIGFNTLCISIQD